jgi:hypothetical protein
MNNNNAKAARGQPNQARKKCHWKNSTKKLLNDCSLMPYEKFKLKVRLTGQLAD